MRALAACALLVGGIARAACPLGEKNAADTAISNYVQSLNYPSTRSHVPGLEKLWERHGRCDAGPLADSFSEAVAKTLASMPPHLEELGQAKKKNPKFYKWALGHLDGAASLDSLKRTQDNANNACPANAGAMCREIAEKIDKAIDELRLGKRPQR